MNPIAGKAEGEASDSDFVELERQFTRHLRDNDQPPPDGLEDQRVGIYRNLVYNSIQGLLANYFPVLRLLLGKEKWHRLMRDYVRKHASSSPLFPHLSTELVSYLETEREETPDDPPWLLDLARYESSTREISISPIEISMDGIEPQGDLWKGVPALNPLAHLLSYHYPVHRIRPTWQPDEPQTTHLIVCRDKNDKIRYLIANDATAYIFSLLKEKSDSSGNDLCTALLKEMPSMSADVMRTNITSLLEQMRTIDIILGTVSSE